jgi:uncharacterized protein YbjT (DUF2867 family)
MPNNTILVTGATGNVGGPLAKLLHEQGQPVRAAVSSPASAQRLPDSAIPWTVLNFEDLQTFTAAFDGVDRLFLMRPPQMADVDKSIKPLIDYAASAGVRHVAFLSLIGAEKNKVVPHAKIEALLLASPMTHTLLRAGFFMQNLSTTHRQDLVEHDDVFIPAGKGKTAFVDTRDLAAVAALALSEAGHENKAYPLTGSESIDYYQVADILSEVLDRRITYSDPSPFRFAWRMHSRGAAWAYVAVTSAIYMTTRLGMAAPIHPQLSELLGRPPITFRQFAEDEAAVWRK